MLSNQLINMNRTLIIALVVILVCNSQTSYAQIYYTKNGRISFFSSTSLQDIQADNNQVLSVLNLQTGALQFSVLNDAFYFPKAKMQEDFNENYIESNKYPMSAFKGKITDISSINLSKQGTYKVSVNGDLTIHGVTKNITAPGTIIIKDGKISSTSSFNILLKDYDIAIPTIVNNKIAEKIKITMNCNYQKKS